MARDLSPDAPTDDLVTTDGDWQPPRDGQSLLDATNGSIQRLLQISKRHEWSEITADCREALQFKSVRRGRLR